MNKTSIVVMFVLAVLIGGYGIAEALPGATGPHADYRTGYGTGCSGNAACHTLTKVSFLPEDITNNPAVNFTNFCLSCHNKSGEAHEKSPGSPSNNTYVNATGLVPGNKGVSHNWNGVIGNSGTRVPTSSGFIGSGTDGKTYMPGNKVACQTCHNAPVKGSENINWVQASDSGDHINYTILGYASTPQYLNQYLKVYRSAGAMSTPPTQRRDRKAYLVDASEYTYNNANATITFSASQGTNYIYVEVAEPYMRVSNAANAACMDCHNNRVDTSVSHPSGSGVKDNHPTAINYGYNFGLHSTLKPAATGNAYLENGQVLCTSCHDPHNAASGNGQILREADGTALCADCHRTTLGGYSSASQGGAIVNIHNGSKHSSPTVCLDCHGTHNSNNIMLIRNVINGKAVNFQSFTGARSFGPDTGYGICEVCHSATGHHLADNSPAGQGHNTGLNCITCHSHSNGFQPTGGSCDSCHGFPPGNAGKGGPSGWTDTTGGKHVVHMTYIRNKFGAGLTDTQVCAYCHGASIPTPTHNTGKSTALIDTSSWGGGTFSDGGTIGKTSVTDDSCANVSCHSTAGTRYWLDTVATCDTCHPYPGSPTNDFPSSNGHSVRYDDPHLGHMAAAGYNAATDTYDAMVADNTKCGKCHPNVPSNHQNGVRNLSPNGWAACGGGNFTVNVVTTGSAVTCDNVLCHAGKRTPNWW